VNSLSFVAQWKEIFHSNSLSSHLHQQAVAAQPLESTNVGYSFSVLVVENVSWLESDSVLVYSGVEHYVYFHSWPN